jgi:hypothetical protein
MCGKSFPRGPKSQMPSYKRAFIKISGFFLGTNVAEIKKILYFLVQNFVDLEIFCPELLHNQSSEV